VDLYIYSLTHLHGVIFNYLSTALSFFFSYQVQFDAAVRRCHKLSNPDGFRVKEKFPPVGIATSYGLDDRGVGVRVPVGSRIFSSPNRPDRLWGPPNLPSTGYRGGSFPGGKAAGA
jgi:hypothetical protein